MTGTVLWAEHLQCVKCNGVFLGWLKARFGALRKAMDINIDDLCFVIYACLFCTIFVR